MGSFNMKCCFTGMDIVAGDPIVALLGIKPGETPYQGGYEGQSSVFQPRTVPLFGDYNDYGWLERNSVDPDNLALVLKVLELFYPDEIHNLESLREKFVFHPWDKGETNAVAFIHRGAWDALLEGFKDHEFSTTLFFRKEDTKTYPDHICSEYDHTNVTATDMFKRCLKFHQDFPLQELPRWNARAQDLYDKALSAGMDEKEAAEIAEAFNWSYEEGCPAHERFAGAMVGSMLPFWPKIEGPRAERPEKYKVYQQVLKDVVPIIQENPQPWIDLDTVITAVAMARRVIRAHQDMPTAAQWIEPEMHIVDLALARWMIHYHTVMHPWRDEE